MLIRIPREYRGRREGRVLVAPAASCAGRKSTRVRNHRFDRCDPAFPARWCYGVYAISPVCRAV